MQCSRRWPNIFRPARDFSANDSVQADRFRRKVAMEMARVLSQVDLLLVPSLHDEMLVVTDATGQPSLTLRAGFIEVSKSRSDWAPDPAHPLVKFLPATARTTWSHAHRAASRRRQVGKPAPGSAPGLNGSLRGCRQNSSRDHVPFWIPLAPRPKLAEAMTSPCPADDLETSTPMLIKVERRRAGSRFRAIEDLGSIGR